MADRPVPPPAAYKHSLICKTAIRFQIGILVETGTAWGSTVAASLDTFHTIHSIELADEFFNAACQRFGRHVHVRMWHGDSSEQLPRVLEQLTGPTLFWLDAHYSGEGTARADTDTPIVQELRMITAHHIKNHAILVDDARCFNGSNGYPSLDWCREFVSEQWPSYEFTVKHDIIRITPKNGSAVG